MSIWEYILLFLSVLFGGGLAFLVRENKPTLLRLLLSFGGSYILGIAALHLLPAVFTRGVNNIGVWLLLGFFIQLLLEQLSRGVEHGHIHAHRNASPVFGIQILLGLCLHSFIEGMPLSSYSTIMDDPSHTHGTFNHLLYGIILHKAPAAFALVILLFQSQFNRSFIAGSLVVFSTMSPLGALVAQKLIVDPVILNGIMAVVTGSFLHISTTILFEADSTHEHLISWQKMTAIITGFGMALFTLI